MARLRRCLLSQGRCGIGARLTNRVELTCEPQSPRGERLRGDETILNLKFCLPNRNPYPNR